MSGPIPWLTLPKLLTHMTGVESLNVYNEGHEDEGAPMATNSSLPRLASISFGRLGLRICNITLYRHHFASSLDLLRLLVTMHLLEEVTLSQVTIDKASPNAPRGHGTKLRSIVTNSCAMETWPLTLCYDWPQLATDSTESEYVGLHPVDMHVVQAVLQCVYTSNSYANHYSDDLVYCMLITLAAHRCHSYYSTRLRSIHVSTSILGVGLASRLTDL